MKVALVHDDLMRRGGAEKVLLDLHKIYPEAPIYTLAYKRNNTYEEFKEKKIITTWFQYIAFSENIMKWLFYPLGIWAMRSLNLKSYDVIIISTTFGAKYIRPSKDAKLFTYCYTPFRLAWRPDSYNLYANSKGLFRLILKMVVARLRKIDFMEAQRTNYFLAMTEETRQRIIDAYKPKKNVEIVNPAIDSGSFEISREIGDYYLIVSRFEPYKKVDLVIEAFNALDKKLIVVGKGSQESHLKSIAKSNIEFRSGISHEELKDLYSKCIAFVFPQYEDYGLTPLEANASGRPVVAYGAGGVLDTMIKFEGDAKKSTAVFFEKQDQESLIKAIELVETTQFDPAFLRKHAEKFSVSAFKKKIKTHIEKNK